MEDIVCSICGDWMISKSTNPHYRPDTWFLIVRREDHGNVFFNLLHLHAHGNGWKITWGIRGIAGTDERLDGYGTGPNGVLYRVQAKVQPTGPLPYLEGRFEHSGDSSAPLVGVWGADAPPTPRIPEEVAETAEAAEVAGATEATEATEAESRRELAWQPAS
ncbi:MAG: hypothetical protein M3O15_04275 [Acidobacteriota bacterium]|nr:hypothetical protein [Acidobacteriota bacterium]